MKVAEKELARTRVDYTIIGGKTVFRGEKK